MPKPPVCKSREVIRALTRAGFEEVDQEGSHVKLRKGSLLAIVPDHGGRDVPLGTLSSILRQIGMSVDEFKAYLSGNRSS